MLEGFFNNRYLIRELVARDIRNRYVGSLMGVFWSILNPLLQLGLYTLVFAGVMGQRFDESGSTGRYALFLFAALLPWMTLQEAVNRSAFVFLENSNLIKKVSFPLSVLPFSLCLSSLIHQALGTLVFGVVLAVLGELSWSTLPWLLGLLPLQFLLMYGLGTMVACLNVFFRDVGQVLGVGFTAVFWLTPIVYPPGQAPQSFSWILEANPLTHMVEAYRYALLGQSLPGLAGLAYWAAVSIAFTALGSLMLRRGRGQILDLV